MSIYIAHRRKKRLWCAECAEYWSKRHVFRVRQKQSICMSGSRKLFWNKFHVIGPATAKARRPHVSSWNCGTTSRWLPAEPRRCRSATRVTGAHSPDKQSGARPRKHLYTDWWQQSVSHSSTEHTHANTSGYSHLITGLHTMNYSNWYCFVVVYFKVKLK